MSDSEIAALKRAFDLSKDPVDEYRYRSVLLRSGQPVKAQVGDVIAFTGSALKGQWDHYGNRWVVHVFKTTKNVFLGQTIMGVRAQQSEQFTMGGEGGCWWAWPDYQQPDTYEIVELAKPEALKEVVRRRLSHPESSSDTG